MDFQYFFVEMLLLRSKKGQNIKEKVKKKQHNITYKFHQICLKLEIHIKYDCTYSNYRSKFTTF